jgi:hypothetical protein
VSTPHLPPGIPLPPTPRGVVPLGIDLGAVAGQRVVLLSLEVWEGWADLRFARVDVGATQRLTRRVPPAAAWSITADGEPLQVFDAVGRGDRTFSNGEVRLVPAPALDAALEVRVEVVPGQPPLTTGVTLFDDGLDESVSSIRPEFDEG